jgi:GNAT superfamily N-acetyltransferase
MDSDITVRHIEARDLSDVTALCDQLGYRASERDVSMRLRRLTAHPDHQIVVAVRDGRVVGWIHLHLREGIESGPDVEVGGLVVDRAHRGTGIGRLLMSHAEAWAVERGCTHVRLRSNVVREGAHAFYRRLGFRIQKTQYAFIKSVAGMAASA